jgi:hypothetical protein
VACIYSYRVPPKNRDRIPLIIGKHGTNTRIVEGCGGSNLLIRMEHSRPFETHNISRPPVRFRAA